MFEMLRTDQSDVSDLADRIHERFEGLELSPEGMTLHLDQAIVECPRYGGHFRAMIQAKAEVNEQPAYTPGFKDSERL